MMMKLFDDNLFLVRWRFECPSQQALVLPSSGLNGYAALECKGKPVSLEVSWR
jgi:hypothetical protein